MSEARRLRAQEYGERALRRMWGDDADVMLTNWAQWDCRILVDELEKFAEAEVRAAVAEFVAKVNARAEADILAGRPITGAHHRAMGYEVTLLCMGGDGGPVPPGAPTP